jgi:saccharopine dehydrogenase-like NADP-dependent oxidoreductase
MKNIFVIGAGRSASSLIKYLLENSEKDNWFITIGDMDVKTVEAKINGHKNAQGIEFDVFNEASRNAEIEKADLVISMLPARFHMEVARECVKQKKNMVTASYVSEEMAALNEEAKANGVIIMNEIGLDPGLDHLSAMKIIDQIKSEGHKLEGFESFTGGLIAPEYDNNPWNYKFTWNPRNVVLAGQGGASMFRQNGTTKYIPYNKLFRRTERIEIDGYGFFEGYANRDSLKYIDIYNLGDIKTIFRGTFRRPGYSRAWNSFVQLGVLDDTYTIESSENLTYREFINLFLPYNPTDSVELKLRHYLNISLDNEELWNKLVWLDIFSDKKVELKNATPAQIMQKILEEKLSLEPDDKDMIAMWHKFNFIDKNTGKHREVQSSLIVLGDDQTYTSMAKTVGLPVAIAAKLILNGTIKTPGVHIPTTAEVYNPVLNELENYGIIFKEKEVEPKLY